MPYSLLIDVVVAVLLMVTIGYAVRLNKRLGLLRRDKAELEKLAVAFTESTMRADESLGRLRSTADMMQQQIVTAQGLHDDLAFLLDRGEKAADRLEDAVRKSRDVDHMMVPSSNHSVAGPLAAAKAAIAPADTRQPQSAEIEDVNAGMTRPAPTVASQENDKISAQTEAERELLKALRSGH
ncbi:MAG: hypothetical protein HQ501_11355 [Rhodospirillales bacterium]|nr:hypothetical protein [Rhodospirillales bacterium]